MTTIATDGKTMAADSMINGGGYVENNNSKKLFKVECPQFGNVIVGFAGCQHLLYSILDHVKTGTLPTREDVGDDSFEVTLLTKDGRIFKMASSYLNYVECSAPNGSGTGDLIARGAMIAGASPKEAVEIASQVDVYTGGKINVMGFEE